MKITLDNESGLDLWLGSKDDPGFYTTLHYGFKRSDLYLSISKTVAVEMAKKILELAENNEVDEAEVAGKAA